MSEAAAETTKQPDPTEKFRELRDAYLEIWSKNLIETVNSEGYAKASGAALDGLLAVAAPLKEPTEQMMLKTLQQLNMPTSADFAGLAGRLTNVELLLDNMDAKLDRIEKLLPASKSAPSDKPVDQERAKPLASARKTASKGPSPLQASGTSKRATTAKPTRRSPRKGRR